MSAPVCVSGLPYGFQIYQPPQLHKPIRIKTSFSPWIYYISICVLHIFCFCFSGGFWLIHKVRNSKDKTEWRQHSKQISWLLKPASILRAFAEPGVSSKRRTSCFELGPQKSTPSVQEWSTNKPSLPHGEYKDNCWHSLRWAETSLSILTISQCSYRHSPWSHTWSDPKCLEFIFHMVSNWLWSQGTHGNTLTSFSNLNIILHIKHSHTRLAKWEPFTVTVYLQKEIR